MSLSKLPSEVLSSVLNNRSMPLRHRLRLRLLSARCCAIIEDGLKKKSSLVLRDQSGDFYLKLKPNHLVVNSGGLTDEHIPLLVRLFSGLTQLTLKFEPNGNEVDSWRAVPPLLTQLSTPNLKTVQLSGYDPDGIQVKPFVDALLALPSLTSLILVGYHLSCLLLPHLAPVVRRLEKFACPTIFEDTPLFLSSSLSSGCTHLMFSHNLFTTFSDATLTQLSASLTHLHLLGGDNTNWPSISLLHQLTCLILSFDFYSPLDSSLFRNLAPFPLLTDVKLYSFTYPTPLDFPLENSPVLPSIKYLTFQVNFPDDFTNFQTFFRALGFWFPSLTGLTLLCRLNLHLDIQVSLGETPFTVGVLDYALDDPLSPKW